MLTRGLCKMSNSIFLQRVTARFEIVFLLLIISHCYTLCKTAKLAHGKQILLQKFEFVLYQTYFLINPLLMLTWSVMTPLPPLLTLVNISETLPSPLSVNVIYTRPLVKNTLVFVVPKIEGSGSPCPPLYDPTACPLCHRKQFAKFSAR